MRASCSFLANFEDNCVLTMCDSLLHCLHTVSVLYTSHGGYVHHMVDMSDRMCDMSICTSMASQSRRVLFANPFISLQYIVQNGQEMV